MLHAVVIAYLVDFESIHSCMNPLADLVQHAGVDDTALAYTFYLFRCLDQISGRHELTFVLPIHHLLVQIRRLLS